jgi:hypothetical protein
MSSRAWRLDDTIFVVISRSTRLVSSLALIAKDGTSLKPCLISAAVKSPAGGIPHRESFESFLQPRISVLYEDVVPPVLMFPFPQ